MLEYLRKERDYSVFTYHDYEVSSTTISLEDIKSFMVGFDIFLHSDFIREQFGYIYDVTICYIDVTSDKTCDITFICRVSI